MEGTADKEKEYYLLVRKVFRIIAPFYDIGTIPISGLRDKAVNFTNAGMGSKFLDVATGTGKQAFAFAKRGYDVTGIDLSEAMLKVAIKKNKCENAKFALADATNLPFKNRSFDVSCISFALHDMPLTIIEKVLKEMARATKPQGMIIIVDYALPENRIGRFLVYHFVKIYEKEYYSKFIKSDLKALLRKSGIGIKEELPVLLGAGRILKGMRINNDIHKLES
ncbi:MAG: ubiquinone/menaquinone biosynthesis methyltransferase [Candidatus Methanoperedens nitroreducens]|uniref:Ubiquinone/menaquinone biosynthesis methyltransferase n=1 Tax=Candidatus Methanoperedens nitratireducens TaxID=1392998 RepID=A0A0P7ZGL3_9EURY|nr:MAG: ubiquinone/menaquinone biosynthesis methyltransferase [Candidatus Methanoperedens sp. BLZ1]